MLSLNETREGDRFGILPLCCDELMYCNVQELFGIDTVDILAVFAGGGFDFDDNAFFFHLEFLQELESVVFVWAAEAEDAEDFAV